MASKHTSVIYFHGVGDPRRHVSLSSFLDYFDLFGQSQDKSTIGRPRTFAYKSELLGDHVVDFVEFKRVVDAGNGPRVRHTIRVYEAYWVPQALTRFNMVYLFVWFVGRLIAPIKVAFARWRSFPSLKLLALHQIAERHSKFGHLEKLERHYRDYENWENRSAFPTGRFKDFLNLIALKARSQDVNILQSIARQWRRAVRTLILRQLVLVATVSGLALWLLGLGVVSGRRIIRGLTSTNSIQSQGLLIAAFVFLLVFAGFLFMGAKLRSYLFNILAWTMESEKDQRFAARQKVVHLGQELIRHVTSDTNCVSAIIVGHSLGTCIAAEALLKEGQRAKVSENAKKLRDIGKVRTVFTVGSPIDRIFFFFQADTTFSHRYHRLLEEQRISLSLPPFRFKAVSGRARLYNFWSRFDPISSPCFSLRKAISERRDALFNIEVLPRNFPLPLSTHTSYFSDPRLMGMIYRAVIVNAVPPLTNIDVIDRAVGARATFVAPGLYVLVLGSGTALLIGANPGLVSSAFFLIFVLMLSWRVNRRKRYETEIGKFLGRGT